MKLYVAGKYATVAIETVVGWLEEQGHTFTYPWWSEGVIPKPYQEFPEFNFPIAERMRDGVRDADCLVLVVSNGMMGGWVEFGIALASLKPIICVGAYPAGHPIHTGHDSRRDSIFELFPCVRHAEVKSELLAHLADLESNDANAQPRGSGAPIMVDQAMIEPLDEDDDREPLIEHTEGAE